MPIDLAPTAFLTLAEAREFLNLGDTLSVAQESLVNDCVNRVSALIEDTVVHRFIARRTFTALRLPAPQSHLLFPPATPISIAQTITLSIDAVVQTVWTEEGDGDPADFDVVVSSTSPGSEWSPNHFYRAGGWAHSSAPLPILLTYTGGFSPIPERYKQAAREWLQEIYSNQTKGMTAIETITTPTGSFTKSMRAIPPRVDLLLGPDRLVSV